MNYLAEITKYLRENLNTTWANRVYRSANINVVDDAYSANSVEYLFTAFLLPLDVTTGTTDEGLSAKIYRFGVYLFVPNGDNQEGTPAEEQCEEAEQQITALLKTFIPTDGVEEVQFSSAREYRYGRGYYIYEIQYQYAIFNTDDFTGNYTLSFYHANVENQDMSYGYEKTLLTECYVDRQHGINRSPDGLAHNNVITIRYCGEHVGLFSNADLRINNVAGHDFVVLGDVNTTNKQTAINAGYEVFEINTIRPYFDKEHNCIAVEITGN